MNLALKIAILSSGKRQQRVADLAHINRTKLSHIVAGRRSPSEKEAVALCAVLGESRETLALFEDKRHE